MKNKNGFTLIELLAVIVILAVIALIATPLVMNTIEDAKDGSLKSTARNIIEIAETEYAKKLTEDPNTIPSIDFSTLSYKGEKVDGISGSFTKEGTANIAIYKGDKCIYKTNTDKDVVLDQTLSQSECLMKAEEVIGDPLVPALIAQPGTSSDTLEGFKDNGNGIYTYTGASGTVGTNYLWYGGHLWRIMKIDGNKLTLITSYPTTAIQWGSSVVNQPSLEQSYVGDWLNNVFLKSLPSNVQNKLEPMTYTRKVYNGSSVVPEEVGNVKVRLLTEAEYTNSDGADHYLDIKDYQWLADIYSSSSVRGVNGNGTLGSTDATIPYGVRAVVEVTNITFTEGEGTLTEPYLAGEKVAKTTNEIKVGEYVSVPKSDGTSYFTRVVKHDENGTKVILNGLALSTSAFGDSTTFSSSSTIYTGALTSFKNTLDLAYFDSTNKAFEITMYGSGVNYKSDSPVYVSDINIGLPSVGELFSGNDIDLSTSTTKTFVDGSKIENATKSNYYWMMNAYSSSNVRYVSGYGNLGYGIATDTYGVRAVWYISDMDVKGGNGTLNDPYRLK